MTGEGSSPDGGARPLHSLRRDYESAPFDETDLSDDPIDQFSRWFDEARAASIMEPNAMTIATVDEHGRPDARIVLLKEFRPEGFVFFTNYDSTKGRQLEAQGDAALVFYWDVLERQVRVTGRVERISPEESSQYFASRPVKSQIGAIASPQSRVMEGRAELEEMFRRVSARFETSAELERPGSWGGYLVRPRTVEFWQGRRSRLHDRLRYLHAGGEWLIERLAP